MNISILCIGDELLIGQVVNTNASWLAEKLTLAGFSVNGIHTVGDKLSDILEGFSIGLARAEVLIVSGGLGPTSDDRTREALCSYYHCGMHSDPIALKDIERIFSRRGLSMTDNNLRQAEVPDKCEPVYNPAGTSPGMWFDDGGRHLIAMPGVPFELKQMFSETILPKLVKIFNPGSILYRNVLTQGMGESFLAETIKHWEENLPGQISLAYLPQPGIVRLRLMAKGDDKKALEAAINDQINKLINVIPGVIFGYDDDTMESITGSLLVKLKATLSTAESCTGGYIAHLITSVPGSSRYYKGSIIAYDNEIKTCELHVHKKDIEASGAVSREVVTQMAEGIRQKYATDYSIAVTGIAGPDGGTPEKPVGLVYIAVAGPKGIEIQKENFGDNRERHIRRTGLTALNMLRKMLVNDSKIT